MQNITAVTSLLKIANVSKLTIETLPKVLQTLTDNKIKLREQEFNLRGQEFNEIFSLLKSAPSAMTVAYEAIQNSVQKAFISNDRLSLEYIKELLNLFKSSGISDKRIADLLKNVESHEHEIRLERTKGFFSLAKFALVGITTILISVITKSPPKPPEKHPFWYK